MYYSLFNVNVVKLLSLYNTAPEIIDVRIHQEVLLQGSLRHLQYGMLIGWFSCPTPDCNEDWNKHWIADIRFMEKVILENPHYSAFLNGTLLIKKVLLMFNGRYFIRRVRTASGDEPNIYHLKVVQGNVYLLIILFYMLSPCILLTIFCVNLKENGFLTSLTIFLIFPPTYFQSTQF